MLKHKAAKLSVKNNAKSGYVFDVKSSSMLFNYYTSDSTFMTRQDVQHKHESFYLSLLKKKFFGSCFCSYMQKTFQTILSCSY